MTGFLDLSMLVALGILALPNVVNSFEGGEIHSLKLGIMFSLCVSGSVSKILS